MGWIGTGEVNRETGLEPAETERHRDKMSFTARAWRPDSPPESRSTPSDVEYFPERSFLKGSYCTSVLAERKEKQI